jgi:hypothetical protein
MLWRPPLQIAGSLRSGVPGERAVALVPARRASQDVPYYHQALLTQHLYETGDTFLLYLF